LSSKLKCPIVGDFKYNFVDSFKLQFNQKKLYLHSNIVEFTSINGKKIKVDAPFDDDFLEALKYLNLL
jgi:23S rRNA-/tRNA-specific pseudouridylate synthase